MRFFHYDDAGVKTVILGINSTLFSSLERFFKSEYTLANPNPNLTRPDGI